jgi:hypothetical protein
MQVALCKNCTPNPFKARFPQSDVHLLAVAFGLTDNASGGPRHAGTCGGGAIQPCWTLVGFILSLRKQHLVETMIIVENESP